MYSSRKATIIFVAILLLFLFSFVSAELNKRDPQGPGGGGGAPPAGGGGGGGAAGGGNQPPAGGAGGGGGAPPAGGGNQPAAGGAGGGGGGAPPAGGGNQPAAGGAGGGNQPAAGGGGGAAAPPAAGGGGGNNPSPAGNPPGPAGGGGGNNPSPAGNPPGPAGGGGGNNPSPAGNPPGPAGAGGGNPTGGSNPTNGTAAPKYVDPSVLPLQVQMIEPKSAKNIIYKIGTNITFKWSYSNNGDFADPPKVVVVQAELVQTDSKVKTFYPIQNLTLVTNSTQVAFWNTAEVSSLPMSEYKLWISDQDGPNGTPKPGGLQTFSGLQFGLYTSQDTGTFCATCSNAISISMISLSSTIGVALLTVASFNLKSI